MAKKRVNPAQKSLEERLNIARKINEYRAAGERLEGILKAHFPGVTPTNYYAWNARLKLAELARQANDEQNKVEHFPLQIIPEKAKPKAKTVAPRARPLDREDDDKVLAAALLDVAAKLLRRHG